MQLLFYSRTLKPAPSFIGHDPTVLWTNLLVHGNYSNWKSPYKDLRPWCEPQIVPRLASRFKSGNVLQKSFCRCLNHWSRFDPIASFQSTDVALLQLSSSLLCFHLLVRPLPFCLSLHRSGLQTQLWRNLGAESLWMLILRYAFSSFKDF